MIDNWFFTPINFKNSVETSFSIIDILFTICVGRVWIVTRHFFLEKQAVIGLWKVIGIQIISGNNFFIHIQSLILIWNYLIIYFRILHKIIWPPPPPLCTLLNMLYLYVKVTIINKNTMTYIVHCTYNLQFTISEYNIGVLNLCNKYKGWFLHRYGRFLF